ncbi:MAG: alginate lyase family protein [Anaerolineae bacterium]
MARMLTKQNVLPLRSPFFLPKGTTQGVYPCRISSTKDTSLVKAKALGWILAIGLALFTPQTMAADDKDMIFELTINIGKCDRPEMVIDATLPELPRSVVPINVVEIHKDGQSGQEPVPFQYDPDTRQLTLLLSGKSLATTTRTYRITCGPAAKQPPAVKALVRVEEVADYQGQDSWKISTPGGIYVYHRKGAGFASLLDEDGNDWISYRPRGGSDGKYRGIPNLVHPEGYFHPGGEKCSSRMVSNGPLKAVILSSAEKGKWAVRWDIYPNRATLTVLQAPKAYWFLYEGTPGGKIDGSEDYSIRPGGGKLPASRKWDQKLAVPGWVQFGDTKLKRVLFLYNHNAPSSNTSYWMMQGNMTVFGYGRTGLKKKLSTVPARFTIGLRKADANGSAASAIQAACLPLEVRVTQSEPSNPSKQQPLFGFITPRELAATRQALADEDKVVGAAYQVLVQKAQEAIKHQPQPLKDFHVPAYYGSDRKTHVERKRLRSSDSVAAFHLALAAALAEPGSQDRKDCAKAASVILRSWADTNKTVSGFDGKLVMCYNGTAFVFAAELLDQISGWPKGDRKAFADWAKTILLPASDIKNRKNNWACWGILASLATNRFLQDHVRYESDVARLKEIIDRQIADDGSMPEELKRGSRSFWYTYFALAPMTAAAKIAANNGEDLFAFQPESKGSIKNALQFFYERGIETPSRWPRKVDDEIDREGKHGALLFAMGRIYDVKDWRDVAKHPTWRDYGGLAWICPSLVQPELPPPTLHK